MANPGDSPQTPLGIAHLSLAMSTRDIQECAREIIAAMNRAQFERGYTIDQVLMATMYMIGTGIAARGGILPLDKPLREALPPIVAGYERERSKRQNG